MQLASRLRQTTLGDLLAQIHRTQASGVLELIEPHARHAIHLRRGFVQAVESDALACRLGDLAVRSFGLSRAQIERARWFGGAHGLRLGQALVATGALSPVTLDALLTAQHRQRLEALYSLPDAEVRFRIARPLPPGSVEARPLEPRDVYYDRPRKQRRERVSQATPPRRVPSPAPSRRHRALAELELGPEASDAQARAAFQRCVLDLHPDRTGDDPPDVREHKSKRLMRVLDAWKQLQQR